MSVYVERYVSDTGALPEAGVIRDARARRAKRRRNFAVAVGLVALLAAGVGLIAESGSIRSHSTGRVSAALHQRREQIGLPVPRISPILTGGGYGWCVITSHGGSCPTLPVGAATTVDAGGTEIPHEEPIDLMIAPGVANVLVNGHRGHLTVLGHLPYGLKLVRITFPRGSGVVFYAKSLRAVDAHGRTIGASKPVWGTTPGVQRDVRWWQAPQSPPAGPCQIHAHGLPGLKPEWGHVAAAIQPYPAKIAGRAFASCIDTEYYLHNWPLQTAILLDAAHPGTPPAAIPDMHSIPGEPGLFAAPGDWNGKITARRSGNAWLIVAGGSGLAQRIQVLRHLHPTISLPTHDAAG